MRDWVSALFAIIHVSTIWFLLYDARTYTWTLTQLICASFITFIVCCTGAHVLDHYILRPEKEEL